MNSRAQSKEYWEGVANQKKRLIVFYGGDVIDLTGFASEHPGGLKAISVYRLKDIKNIIFRVYPHPQSILTVIAKNKCGTIKGFEEKEIDSPQSLRKGICFGSKAKQKKQKGEKNVCFAADEKTKKKGSKKNGSSVKSLSTSKLKPPLVDESEIDLEDDKPELRVPLFQIRLGRNQDNFSLQNQPLQEIQ